MKRCLERRRHITIQIYIYLYEINCPLKNSSFSPRKDKTCQKDPWTTSLFADYELQLSVQSEMHSTIAVCTLRAYNLRGNLKAFRRFELPQVYSFYSSLYFVNTSYWSRNASHWLCAE